MDPNNQTPADESKISEEPVRCDAFTRIGSPCNNLAIAEGRCWMHGGRKKKSPPENENISGAGPVLAEAAAISVQEESDAKNAGSEPPAAEVSEAIEISAADIELISEGEAPGGLPEAAVSLPAEAGQPEIVWEDELPDKAAPVSGAAELEILWEDGLPDEEPSEDGMELGIEIDAGEPDAEDSESQPLLLPDGELPGEETEGGIDFDADSLGLEMEEETGIETPVSELQQGVGLEEWVDKPDKRLSDQALTDAAVEVPDVSLEIPAESEDDWLGANDINRFGTAAGHPKVNDVPEFAAPDGEQSNRQIPQVFYPRHSDPVSGDVAPEYKTRTTIGKFQEIHVDSSRKGELKKTKGEKPAVKKGAFF